MTINKGFVFAYHNVSNKLNIGLNNIYLKRFKKHIRYLNQINNNNIEVCFDDAYADIYLNTFDYLKKTNLKKTIFVIGDYINKYNSWDINFIINKKMHISEDHIINMDKNNWNIGSHGLTHTPLNKLTANEVIYELEKSKDILERIINKPVDSFTPPFGILYPKHIKSLTKVGYKYIYLNGKYIKHLDKLDGNHITVKKRHNVYSINSINSLKRKMNNNIFQEKLDNFIHTCSYATVITKEILSFNAK